MVCSHWGTRVLVNIRCQSYMQSVVVKKSPEQSCWSVRGGVSICLSTWATGVLWASRPPERVVSLMSCADRVWDRFDASATTER
jgi:hypothetical protein